MTLRELLSQADLSPFLERFQARGTTVAHLVQFSDADLVELGMLDADDRARLRSALDGLTSVRAASSGSPPPGRHVSPTGDLGGMTTVQPEMAQTPARVGAGGDALPPVPARLGSYRVLGELGAGGMGRVVRARHIEEGWAAKQGGDVAIKLIHPHLASDPSFRARFISEADLGRRVQHPSLVPTLEVLTDGPWLGTVMALVAGVPLTTRVRLGGAPISEVVSLLAPIAEALDYLHGQGIVHRDLKPANILVRADGRPIVLDFGIAKDLQTPENNTRTMTAMGTSAWMAPEQADAKHVDGAADRYALGLIAYVLLAGRQAWTEGVSEARILADKLYGQVTPLSEVRSGLSPQTYAAVARMIATRPEDRFATCADFIAALAGAEVGRSGPAGLPAKASAPVPPPAVVSPSTTSLPHAAPQTVLSRAWSLFTAQAGPLLLLCLAGVGFDALVTYLGGLITLGYGEPVFALFTTVLQEVLFFGPAVLLWNHVVNPPGSVSTDVVPRSTIATLLSGFNEKRAWTVAVAVTALYVTAFTILALIGLICGGFLIIWIPGALFVAVKVIRTIIGPVIGLGYLATALAVARPKRSVLSSMWMSVRLMFTRPLLVGLALSIGGFFEEAAGLTVVLGVVLDAFLLCYATALTAILREEGGLGE